jgi:hypothetical protein
VGPFPSIGKLSNDPIVNLILGIQEANEVRMGHMGNPMASNFYRLAGKELLKFASDEITIAQLKDRIAKTTDYLKNIKQSEVDGTESKEISITFPSGQTRQFTGQTLLLGHSLPNFYFHATTAYDIIRQCGVEIGKRDFMGTPPTS